MGPAPIPPHERSWRHPSELAPTAPAFTDDEGDGSRWTLALATGAVAVAVFAVFAITTAPNRASGPVAMSSTTLPAFSVSPVAAADATSLDAGSLDSADPDSASTAPGPVRLAQPLLSTSAGLALTGAPKAVAAPVAIGAASPPSASSTRDEPDPATPVHLITESHLYLLTWGDLERVIAPDGSVVIDSDGLFLGTFVAGRFVAD